MVHTNSNANWMNGQKWQPLGRKNGIPPVNTQERKCHTTVEMIQIATDAIIPFVRHVISRTFTRHTIAATSELVDRLPLSIELMNPCAMEDWGKSRRGIQWSTRALKVQGELHPRAPSSWTTSYKDVIRWPSSLCLQLLFTTICTVSLWVFFTPSIRCMPVVLKKCHISCTSIQTLK